MEAVLLILVQNTMAAAFAIVSRKLAPRLTHSYFQFTVITLGIELIAGLAWVGVFGGAYIADLWRWLPYLLGGGVAFAITNALSFKVFQHVDAAVASLLSTFNILAAIIVSTIVIQEGLSLSAAAGAACIICASWLTLSAHVSKQVHRSWMVGLGLSITAALFFSIATVNEKYLLNHMSLSSYLVWGWGAQVLAAVVFSMFLSRGGYREIVQAKAWKLLSISGLIRASSGLCFVLALVTINNLSVVSALSGLKIMLAAAFGLLFLHEGQFLARKVTASVLAAVGVAVLFW